MSVYTSTCTTMGIHTHDPIPSQKHTCKQLKNLLRKKKNSKVCGLSVYHTECVKVIIFGIVILLSFPSTLMLGIKLRLLGFQKNHLYSGPEVFKVARLLIG